MSQNTAIPHNELVYVMLCYLRFIFIALESVYGWVYSMIVNRFL